MAVTLSLQLSIVELSPLFSLEIWFPVPEIVWPPGIIGCLAADFFQIKKFTFFKIWYVAEYGMLTACIMGHKRDILMRKQKLLESFCVS